MIVFEIPSVELGTAAIRPQHRHKFRRVPIVDAERRYRNQWSATGDRVSIGFADAGKSAMRKQHPSHKKQAYRPTLLEPIVIQFSVE